MDNLEIINQFGAYVSGMVVPLREVLDMSSDLIYGEDVNSLKEIFFFVALPLKPLGESNSLTKDSLDKLYSIFDFFSTHVLQPKISGCSIYLTQRNGKLVMELAWSK